MQAEMPFYEHPEDALTACVQALGGAKVVGAKLWPDKSVEAARSSLLDCLNHERKEKLSYTQIIFICREARHVGFHAGFEYLARECGYEAKPIVNEEEVDRLVYVVEQTAKTLSVALQQLERMQRGNLKAVA